MIIESSNIIQTPVVSVVIITYNQQQYISQCIDAILSQKTNFPFEIIISDDCSSDQTPNMCKSYQQKFPDRIRLLLQDKNKGVAQNFGDAIALARGKYIASMAGDDYWVADNKLQIQKDYLDSHESCVLCYTNINTCDESGKIIKYGFMSDVPKSRSFKEHLITKGYIAPLTWMYRKELVKLYDIRGAYTDESFAFALDAFASGDVHYVDIITAHYRLTNNSLSRPITLEREYRQWLGVFRSQCYYITKYATQFTDIEKNRILSNGYIYFIPMAYSLNDMDFINESVDYFQSIEIDIQPYINVCRARISAEKARDSKAYKLGKAILKPFKWLKK